MSVPPPPPPCVLNPGLCTIPPNMPRELAIVLVALNIVVLAVIIWVVFWSIYTTPDIR